MRVHALPLLAALGAITVLSACGSGSFDVTDDTTVETDTDTDADADADTDADTDSDTDADVEPGTVITAADCTETCSDWCEVHPVTGSTCLTECHPDRQTNVGLCCPVGTKAVGDTCPLPDLSVDGADLRNSLSISTMRESDREYRCALEEGCLNGTGDRRLIRFDTTTPNTGVGDMHVGDPNQATDLFDTQTCHGHDHFDSYAWYEISGNNLNGVTTGRKQAFCLMDFTNWGSNSPGRYDCGNQGIQAGWADTYYSGLPCQYIDITDVPSGEYTLSVHVNYESVIAESDYSNNITEVTVNIP